MTKMEQAVPTLIRMACLFVHLVFGEEAAQSLYDALTGRR